MMNKYIKKYPWPRRKFIRGLLSFGIDVVGGILTHWEVSGKENIPAKGPLLIVGNHFSFLDTVAPIHSTHWPLEFIGDFEMPNAPSVMRMFPRAWETLRIEQGTPNFEALQASEAILEQEGVLVIYPEGHVHSGPLNPALPGAAFMALRTGVPILPIGTISDNNWKLLKTISEKKRRLGVFTKIGEVFGPIKSENPNRPTRSEISSAGDLIMRRIAALLPKEYRGVFDPELS
ncbi:MAG: lysophospholipid acyltransferase family protein [Chloroflexota bacterium]|nr:lysophospholipid acyltransferase family protein [Chloroflexota bacterium]